MKPVYLCEKCNSTYPSELKAAMCETSHLPLSSGVVVKEHYSKPSSYQGQKGDHKFPQQVTVKFGRWTVNYENHGGHGYIDQ